MSEKISIKKNLAFETIYQITSTCLPLITSPYLSRIMGASQLGVYSFTSSIVSYFMVFAMLGTFNHGTRSIATCRDDITERSRVFWSIFRLHAVVNIICVCAYTVYLLFFCKENNMIATIQIIELSSCFFNIAWLFTGMERIQFTATINLIIRVASVVLILVLVKKPEDLWIYALITVLSALISQAVLWVYLPKLVVREKVTWRESLNHLKPSLLLFIPLLAMSVYHIMDKTMLGLISNYEQSGYYYNVDKIVNIMVGIISGVSTVMFPRMSSLISQGKKKESNDLFRVSLEGTVLAGTAIAFGIAAIAKEFEPLFFGPGYDECIMLTIVLAPVLIIKSFSITARYQYLIPHHKEKDFIASVIAGAVVNLIANYILIPKIGAMGAVIGTLAAEFTACIIQFASIRKMISIKITLLRSIIYMVFGTIMFAVVRIVALVQAATVVRIVLEVLSGAVIFALLCFMYWRMTNNNILENMFSGMLKRFKR